MIECAKKKKIKTVCRVAVMIREKAKKIAYKTREQWRPWAGLQYDSTTKDSPR